MTHTIKALRLNLVNSLASVGWPWAIVVISFVVNLAIYGLLDEIPIEDRQTGALASLYFVAIVANLQLWTQGFSFAMGLSLTRKAFFGGTVLFILLQSLFAGVVLTALAAVERATGGWGVDMKYFGPWFLDQSNVVVQFLMYALPFAALSALGLLIGVVLKRWGQSGIYLLSIGSFVVVGGAAVLITWRDWWGGVGRYLGDASFLGLSAGYPAVLALAFAGLAYLALRRATP